MQHPGEPENPVAISRNGKKWESICCAAFYFACNQGSVGGSPIHHVIPRMIAHLLITDEIRTLSMEPFVGKFQDYIFPFMSPYNSPWHEDVHSLQGANFADVYRARNSDRVDVFVSMRGIQLEMKVGGTTSDIQKALECIDGRCQIAFIFCHDKLKDSFYNRSLRSIKRINTLDRKHVLKTSKRYNSLSSTAVLILKLEKEEVKVEAHPESPCPLESADSVIFIISREGINDGVPPRPKETKSARND